MSTSEQPRAKAHVEKPDEGDLQMVIHGLSGIFWVLDQLVVDNVLGDVADKRELENAVAGLIIVGGILTEQLKERF